ncbi:MAG: hypothetical protein KGZ67_01790 [Hydrogenophaga sp.]|jgi:hypothetical protein|nr:hypothetical protein [Hydrogenophaga sp.]
MRCSSRLTALAGLLVAASGWAASTFDPVSGTGQVPGREVQTLLGWTDAQFQERAPAVSFSYHASGHFNAVCAWTNAQGARMEEPRTVNMDWQASVNSSLRHDVRNPQRIEGFQLLGFGGPPGTGAPVPEPGAPCPGAGGLTGTWLAVVPQRHSGALSARFGGQDVRLPF